MVEYCVLTQFPHLFDAYIKVGLPQRGVERNVFRLQTVQLRKFADPLRKGRIDDAPYGGGPGMILQIAPLDRALKSLAHKSYPIILLTPQGTRLTQPIVRELKQLILTPPEELGNGLIIISGYYQGIDARVEEYLVDYSISIGDFILGSGDLASLILIETINRLLPNYLNSLESLEMETETTAQGSFEYPQYTRPAEYGSWSVPPILLSGHRKAIQDWRNSHRHSQSIPRCP